MGSAAHVRPGTLLEEEAGGAHAVGLKQTIFLSFVTAGSLINFCDGLMAGGTSRKNHSEIGSSYIHFNFTPHQDKATPSLIGDVPRGVMLDQPPIFLGGQGGLVGPVRIAYGTVIPAGTICRQDILRRRGLFAAPEALESGAHFCGGRLPRHQPDRDQQPDLHRKSAGLEGVVPAWSGCARCRRTSSAGPAMRAPWRKSRMDLKERVKRLKELADKMPRSDRARPRRDRRGSAAGGQGATAGAGGSVAGDGARLKTGPPADDRRGGSRRFSEGMGADGRGCRPLEGDERSQSCRRGRPAPRGCRRSWIRCRRFGRRSNEGEKPWDVCSAQTVCEAWPMCSR